MPKPRHLRRNMPAREAAPLPVDKVAEMPFVLAPDGRIIAPWAAHRDMTALDAQRLGCVLDYARQARPAVPVWCWPERSHPEPVEADDPRSWVARWSEGRAVYRAR